MKGVVKSFHMPGAYVVHKHAAWLCLAASFCAGISFGFLLAVLAIVL